MRKMVISACIVVISIFNIYGCAQTAEETPIAEPETMLPDYAEIESDAEANAADAEAGSEGQAESAIPGEEYGQNKEQADPIYIIEPQHTQDDAYEMQDWQIAYTEYIEGLEWNRDCTYSLIYVDDDDIPELVIDTGVEAGGCQILTFYDGEIDLLQTARLNFYYIEGQNIINNSDGHMGYYYDRIYAIENGKWVRVADGEWTETMGDDDWVYRYEWNGKEIKEDVYNKSLNAVFDMEQKMRPNLYYIMDEMLALLKTGDVASRKHCYELFVEDVTWDEARSRCEERGGYLATVTSTEEYERIQKGIVDTGLTDTAFWVGACDNEDVLGQFIFGFGWLEPNKDLAAYGMLGHYNALFIFWEPDEPSYKVEVDGKTIKEDFAYLMYDDTEERCYLYDAPMDMLAVYPEYTGKIGYICEYDSIVVMTKETHYHADGSVDYWQENEYDGTGDLTKATHYNADDSVDCWREYEYDGTGNLTKCIRYYGDGSISYWEEYEYNSAGNETRYIKYNEDGSIQLWDEHEYDSEGNLTKEIDLIYNDDDSIRYRGASEYDSEGNQTTSITYYGDDVIDSWSEYYGYDSAGNLTKETHYNAGGSPNWWKEYEYDSTGNLTKAVCYNADGSVDWRCEHEYDSAGNRTKEIYYYNADGSADWWCEHEYDSRGNKTKQTYYNKNGPNQECEWEYDNMANLTKYMEYRYGELYEWYECEYITINM